MPTSALSKFAKKAYPKSLPVWEIVLILVVFPPIAWYYMLKHRHYHLWLSNSLFIYSIATLVVGLYLFFFDFQSLREIYTLLGVTDGLTTDQILISIPIFLSVTLLIIAIYLKNRIKKQGRLTQPQLVLTLIIIILYSIVIPLGYTLYTFFTKQQLPMGLDIILSKLQEKMN